MYRHAPEGRDAVRWSLLTRNPADLADPPSPSSARAAEMQTWGAPQLQAFLKQTADHRLHAAFVLATTTGMRRGEIAGLKWGDLDTGAARIAVRRALVTAGYEVHWSEPKTERSRRSIAVDPATLEILRAHRAHQAEEKLALGPAYEDQDLVFAREDGQPLHPERLSKLFGASVQAAGLPRIRFHDLRHTHATLALQAGVHPKVVSERLGHGDVGMTLNVYSHAIPALEEEAASRVAALVFGA